MLTVCSCLFVKQTRKTASWTSAANIETLMTVTEASIKLGYVIKLKGK